MKGQFYREKVFFNQACGIVTVYMQGANAHNTFALLTDPQGDKRRLSAKEYKDFLRLADKVQAGNKPYVALENMVTQLVNCSADSSIYRGPVISDHSPVPVKRQSFTPGNSNFTIGEMLAAKGQKFPVIHPVVAIG